MSECSKLNDASSAIFIPRLVLNPPSSLEFLMPFFQGSNDVSVHGGQFTDVKGDWTVYDHSQRIRHINSHNTDTTNVIDSNNDSSVRTFVGMSVDARHEPYASIEGLRRVQARNNHKELSATHEAAIMKQIEQALGPMHQFQPQASFSGSVTTKAKVKAMALRGISGARTPPIPMKSTPHPLPRRDTDPSPIPTSSNPYTSPYKSNNPFGRLLMKTDPERSVRSSSPDSQSTDDMDVDSDDSSSS